MLKIIGKTLKYILIIAIILAFLGALALGYARYIEPDRLSAKDVTIDDPLVKQPITVALFSDTHFGYHYDLENFQDVIDDINEKKPDLILFAGDLMDNLETYSGDTGEIANAFSKLSAPLGKYAVFGNHDYGGGAENEYEEIMTAGGFEVLINETVSLNDYNINLIGIDDCLIGYGDTDIAYSGQESVFNMVLCHEPDVVDNITDSNTDLFLAGHTHGGQVRIPTYTDKFLPSLGTKYDKGLFTLQNDRDTQVYVNVGLGTTKIPFRFLAAPEITYLHLK